MHGLEHKDFSPSLKPEVGHKFCRVDLPSKAGFTEQCRVNIDSKKEIGSGITLFDGSIYRGIDSRSPKGLFGNILKSKTEDEVKFIGCDDGVVIKIESETMRQKILAILGEQYSKDSVILGPFVILFRLQRERFQQILYSARWEIGPEMIEVIDAQTVRDEAEKIETKTTIKVRPTKELLATNSEEEIKKRLQSTQERLDAVGIEKVVRNMSALLGISTPTELPFLAAESGSLKNAVSFAITDTNYDWEINTSKARIRSMETATTMSDIMISEAGINQSLDRKVLIHELAHYLVSNIPPNETLSEGLAEAICWLYAEVFGEETHWESNGSPQQRPIMSSGTGWKMPDCADSVRGFLHSSLGWMGSSAMLQCLGETIGERIHNLRLLVKVSRWENKKTNLACLRNEQGGISVVNIENLPTSDEWFKRLDGQKQGLGSTFKNHPMLQPMTSGTYATFHPANHANKNSPWGSITAFQFEGNSNFGYTPILPMHLPPPKKSFDLSPGTATPLPFIVEVTIGDIYQTMLVEHGIINIDPALILSLPEDENTLKNNIDTHGITVSIRFPNHELGYIVIQNAKITPNDYQHLEKTSIEKQPNEIEDTCSGLIKIETFKSVLGSDQAKSTPKLPEPPNENDEDILDDVLETLRPKFYLED